MGNPVTDKIADSSYAQAVTEYLPRQIENFDNQSLQFPTATEMHFDFGESDLNTAAGEFYTDKYYDAVKNSGQAYAISDGAWLPNRLFATDGIINEDEFDLITPAMIDMDTVSEKLSATSSADSGLPAHYQEIKTFIEKISSAQQLYQDSLQISFSDSELLWTLILLKAMIAADISPTQKNSLIFLAQELIAAHGKNNTLQIASDVFDLPDLREDPGLAIVAERAGIDERQLYRLACKPVDYIDVGADKPTLMVFLDVHTEVMSQFSIAHDVATINPTGLFASEAFDRVENVTTIRQELTTTTMEIIEFKRLVADDEKYERQLTTLQLISQQSRIDNTVSHVCSIVDLLPNHSSLDQNDFRAAIKKYSDHPTEQNFAAVDTFVEQAIALTPNLHLAQLPEDLQEEARQGNIITDAKLVEAIIKGLKGDRATIKNAANELANARMELAALSARQDADASADEINPAVLLTEKLSKIPKNDTTAITEAILKSQDEVAQTSTHLDDLHSFDSTLLFQSYPVFSGLRVMGEEDMRWRDVSDFDFPFTTQIRSYISYHNVTQAMQDDKSDFAFMQMGAAHYNSLRAAALDDGNANVIFLVAEPIDDLEELNTSLHSE